MGQRDSDCGHLADTGLDVGRPDLFKNESIGDAGLIWANVSSSVVHLVSLGCLDSSIVLATPALSN